MSLWNGHENGNGKSEANKVELSLQTAERMSERTMALVAELEVPFDPSVIEWRVTNTTKDKARGQAIPYADQRAYTDRLNTLFTPGGWTRRYSVHTSPNFERGKDKKIVAKVFVTCDLTIFGIGSHSATGEEWADDENAGTSAEAQAFKRASACFGLGRYLYYFTGLWVDLDDRKRPKTRPKLAGWATPEGWLQGLRPEPDAAVESSDRVADQDAAGSKSKGQEKNALVQQIESMARPLGRALYRGILKSVGSVWNPDQIHNSGVEQRVLEHMQAAERGLGRLQSALERVGVEHLTGILDTLRISSLDRVDNLATLKKIVTALEAVSMES